VFDAHREGLERLLAEWSPEQHAELARMLDRLSRALMGEYTDRRKVVTPPGASWSAS
jgi:hypothetical protein